MVHKLRSTIIAPGIWTACCCAAYCCWADANLLSYLHVRVTLCHCVGTGQLINKLSCATLLQRIAYWHYTLCLHAAWRAWTKEFLESENYWQYNRSAQDQSTCNTDKGQQEQSRWSNSWQHFGSSKHSSSWQDYFTSTGKARSSSSQRQHRRDAGGTLYQAQQQHCMHILGLSPTVSLDASVIRTAFLDCAKRWHPDRHSDSAKLDAERKFKDAQTAYQHLLTCLSH